MASVRLSYLRSVLESLVNLVVSEPLLSSLLYSKDSLNFQPLNLGVHSHLKKESGFREWLS